MTDNSDLPIHASFIDSVASPRVRDLLTDAAEFTLDTITEAEILKDIPFVRTVLAVKGVRERFQLRKMYRFFARLREMQQEEREAFTRKIRSEPQQARKVGEAFAVWLDRLDDENKADLLAKVFELFARGHIDFERSARFAGVIDRAHVPYLLRIGSLHFLSGDWHRDEDDIKSHLLAIGLVRVTGYGKDVEDQREMDRAERDIDFIRWSSTRTVYSSSTTSSRSSGPHKLKGISW